MGCKAFRDLSGLEERTLEIQGVSDSRKLYVASNSLNCVANRWLRDREMRRFKVFSGTPT